MFVDRAKVFVESGGGGHGCASFRREKFVPRGGPNGGDGGNGGDVVFVADSRVSTLVELKYRQHIRAKHGQPGRSSRKHGKTGESIEVSLPAGTLIFDEDTGDLLVDLAADGNRIVVARGGKGGRGNSHFANSTNRAPRFAEKGEPGIERTLRLELKVVADVGLVGAPNAGKSTMLAAMSAAHPKIASYPFTTLSPNLGVVNPDDQRHYVVADIPGLIEGASHGAGLGIEFLRHIERTMVIAIVVDSATDHVEKDRRSMIDEMGQYNQTLLDKPRVVVANKMDLPESSEGAKELAASASEPVYEISAATGEGVTQLMRALAGHVEQARRQAADAAAEVETESEPERKYVYRPPYVIDRKDNGFMVRGEKVERLAVMTDWDNDEARQYFMLSLGKLGIFRALARSGASTGDIVWVGPVEFEYFEDE